MWEMLGEWREGWGESRGGWVGGGGGGRLTVQNFPLPASLSVCLCPMPCLPYIIYVRHDRYVSTFSTYIYIHTTTTLPPFPSAVVSKVCVIFPSLSFVQATSKVFLCVQATYKVFMCVQATFKVFLCPASKVFLSVWAASKVFVFVQATPNVFLCVQATSKVFLCPDYVQSLSVSNIQSLSVSNIQSLCLSRLHPKSFCLSRLHPKSFCVQATSKVFLCPGYIQTLSVSRPHPKSFRLSSP